MPPIQGGLFRPFEKEQDSFDDDVGPEHESSSPSSSDSNSPIFDLASSGSKRIRSRNGHHLLDDDASSISSLSSLSSLDLTVIDQKDKKIHLDSHTQREIELDLAKYPRLDLATQDAINEPISRLESADTPRRIVLV